MGRSGMGKLAGNNLTDLEIVNVSYEILKGGPARASQIAIDILNETGKIVTPNRIGHIISGSALFNKDRPGPVADVAWTYSLRNWVIPPNRGARIRMSDVSVFLNRG